MTFRFIGEPNFKWIFTIVFVLLQSAASDAALEAVELTHVPADIKAFCNRIFFRSSIKEEKALYVTPHVVAGRSPIADGEKEVFMDPLPNGNFRLVIGILLPRDSGDNANFYEMRDAQANFCNFEAVKKHLNDLIDDENDKFKKIVHLPVSDMTVYLSNLDGMMAKLTRKKPPSHQDLTLDKETVVLEYVDRTFLAEFEITSEQRDIVNMDLHRGSGLHLDIDFNFQSRQNDGEVIVTTDMNDIYVRFEGQIKAKPRYIGKLEAKAMLENSITRQNVTYEVKGGITESSEGALSEVVSRVLTDIPFSQKASEIPAGEFLETKGDSDYEDVNVVLGAIRNRLSTGFSYKRTTAAMNTSALVHTTVSSPPIDPFIKIIAIKDGFHAKSFPVHIQAGQSIKISPGFFYQARRFWGEKKHYLDKEQMRELGFRDVYDFMHEARYSYEEDEDDFGDRFAVGLDHCYINSWFPKFYNLGLCPMYRFLRVQRFPKKEIRGKAVPVEPKTKQDFFNIPVYVQFSRVDGGQKIFTLSGLLNASEVPGNPFKARIEGETIVVDALKNLGLVSFGDRFKSYDLQKDLRDETNNNDTIRIYSTLPEHPESCPGLKWGGDTQSCPAFVTKKGEDPILLLGDQWRRSEGSYIFSFRYDREITDEARIEYYWGGRTLRLDRMDVRAKKMIADGDKGLPMGEDRVDNVAIKSYRGFVVAVTWPQPTENLKDRPQQSEIDRGVMDSLTDEFQSLQSEEDKAFED